MGQSSNRAQSLKEQLTIKLYLDEMVPTDLARVLRQYGYDVVTAQEAGMLGKTDVEHLEYASAQGRAILTFNIKDFAKLHKSWHKEDKHHSGIIVSPELEMRRFGELLRLCLNLLDQAVPEEIADRLCYLQEFA
jgi:predicted nuclease of predicted toxin-antitoxin system